MTSNCAAQIRQRHAKTLPYVECVSYAMPRVVTIPAVLVCRKKQDGLIM